MIESAEKERKRERENVNGVEAGEMAEEKSGCKRNGPREFWAFDNPYPCCYEPDGDPMTLGEPCGYAIFVAVVYWAARPDGRVRNASRALKAKTLKWPQTQPRL